MEEQLIDIIPDNNIYLAPKSDYLNKIKENIKIELKDFDNKKASSNFYSITKSLREYLMTNDYLSDDALNILSSEKEILVIFGCYLCLMIITLNYIIRV